MTKCFLIKRIARENARINHAPKHEFTLVFFIKSKHNFCDTYKTTIMFLQKYYH
jgi:hypothetical protein